MKNKILIREIVFIAISLFCVQKITAQRISSWGSYIHVRNYNGAIEKKAFTLQIEPGDYEYLNSELSIAVKVNSPIANSHGVFNAERLRIRLNNITGGLVLTNASTEIAHQLNDGTKPIEIIKSSADLRKYKTHQLSFDIIVEGGPYLEDLVRDIAYNVGLTFYVTIRAKNGEILEEVYADNTYYAIGMQIHDPLGGTPPKPTFAFEVNANALLNFTTLEQYTKQVETNPDNSWLKVTSKKDYVITVQTNSENFQVSRLDAGIEGNSDIQVGVVSMEVENREKNKKGPVTPLSFNDKTVYNGNGKNKGSDILNVRYFITAEEARVLATKSPGQYATTLTYTLIPQ